MAATNIQPGHVIEWTNSSGSDVAVGELVIAWTGKVGVALVAIANGSSGSVAISGIHRVAKASGAVTKYATVYRHASTKNITTASTSNTAAGVAMETGTTAATYINVLINTLPGPTGDLA